MRKLPIIILLLCLYSIVTPIVNGGAGDCPCEDIKDGECIQYGPKMTREGNCKDGKMHGIFKFYSKEGVLQQQKTYKNGILDGEKISYTEGIPYMISIYKNGKFIEQREISFEDLEKVTSEESRLSAENYPCWGKEDGQCITYYDPTSTGGKLRVKHLEVYCKNGKRQGVMKQYNTSGLLISEKTYKDSVLDGLVKLYDKYGEVYQETIYENGEKIKEEKFKSREVREAEAARKKKIDELVKRQQEEERERIAKETFPLKVALSIAILCLGLYLFMRIKMPALLASDKQIIISTKALLLLNFVMSAILSFILIGIPYLISVIFTRKFNDTARTIMLMCQGGVMLFVAWKILFYFMVVSIFTSAGSNIPLITSATVALIALSVFLITLLAQKKIIFLPLIFITLFGIFSFLAYYGGLPFLKGMGLEDVASSRYLVFPLLLPTFLLLLVVYNIDFFTRVEIRKLFK